MRFLIVKLEDGRPPEIIEVPGGGFMGILTRALLGDLAEEFHPKESKREEVRDP